MSHTEISIIIPLSAIADSTDLSPSQLLTALSTSVETKHQVEQAQNRCNTLISALTAAGRNLQLILDEVSDPFDKAKALRKLAKEILETAHTASNSSLSQP